MKRGVIPVLACVIAAAAACGSLAPGQRPIDEKPIRFVDAPTGAPIEAVLLLPQYSASTGVSTGGGHGPGAMSRSLYVALPVVYRSGTLLQLQLPGSKGLLLPGVFVGKGLILEGVTVLAPGYAGTWFWELWDRPHDFQVTLTPLAEGAAAKRDRLLAQLDQARIRGADLDDQEREMFNVAPPSSIDIRLAKDERERVRQFILARGR
jgi:hypothetical protein